MMPAMMEYVLSFIAILLNIAGNCQGDFEITILHTNDCHARFAEINKYGGNCNQEDSQAGKCYGGIARRMTEVQRLRNSSPHPVLLLDGGDQYQGTVWFYLYQGRAASYFTNELQYDAMGLGNHEFDNGIEGLVPFLENSTFPILSSNIDATREPTMDGKFQKSTVLTRNGHSIGVIGYTTKDTPALATTGDLIFRDEVQSVQAEVDILRHQGVEIIIAVGHAGFNVDKRIASDIEGIDVVVGGHTNTFLYNGEKPSNDIPHGDYPHVVTHASGKKTLVVQDYAFGKYLGNLDVTFNDDGEVITWGGNPILLDNSIEQDPDTLADVMEWMVPVAAFHSETIGRTHLLLEGRREFCRVKECNLGNFVTDAMVFKHLKNPDEIKWANVTIAIMNSGGIRASIQPGQITMGDLATVWPFGNTIDLVELYGRTLRSMFEHSVSGYDPVDSHGKFLQVAGIRVKYDLSQPGGSRVVSMMIRCSECLVPQYEPIDLDQVYKVIMPSFTAAGGDGYTMIMEEMLEHHIFGDLDIDILLDYVAQMSPVIAELEGRITFVSGEEPFDSSFLGNDTIVGYTMVSLESRGLYCGTEECNMGNLIADALVYSSRSSNPSGTAWSDVTMSLVNSGAIKAPLQIGDITKGDVFMVWPYRDTIDVVTISGITLRNILERSAEREPGTFLQMAGVRVEYEMSKPVGQRVRTIMVRCTECEVPRFERLGEHRPYTVALPSFMTEGGDGYTMIADDKLDRDASGVRVYDAILEYMSHESPITTGIEDRITFYNKELTRPSIGAAATHKTSTLLIVYVMIHLLFI